MDSFAKSMRQSEKKLKNLEKISKTVSTAMKGAFVGLALAGLNMLWDGLVNVTKAAADEAKSVSVLEHAMTKAWKSTDVMNQQQEDFITKMSYMSAIADDKLRPAYAKIVRVTKDATKAQKAFALVLDISAGTGKDVNVVSQAMAKYLGGNTTALDKLVPGLKNAGDKMKYLQDTFGGAAKEVGDQSPFEKLSLVLDDVKERLGTYILPYVQKFADWFTGPEAKQMIDEAFVAIQNFFDYIGSPEGQKHIQELVDSLKDLANALIDIGKWITENKGLMDFLFNSNPFVGASKIWSAAKGPNNAATAPTSNPLLYTPGQSPIQINLKLEGNVTGKSMVTELNKEAKKRGVTVGKMIQ
jgi:hypothetical protein